MVEREVVVKRPDIATLFQSGAKLRLLFCTGEEAWVTYLDRDATGLLALTDDVPVFYPWRGIDAVRPRLG